MYFTTKNNPREIIIFVRYIKDHYVHNDMDKPRNLSKEDKKNVLLITHLQEEAKYYVKKVRILNNSIQKLYGFL